MKFLFLMDVFIFGGCEKMLKEITDTLIENGDEVDLLLIYRSNDNTYLNMLNEKIGVYYLWELEQKGYLKQRLAYWKNVCFPKSVLCRFDFSSYDCVINFKDDYQTNILASKISRPKIAWVHNITEDFVQKKTKSLKYKLAHWAYAQLNNKYLKTFQKFNQVVFVSYHAKEALIKRCKKPMNSAVIYNYLNNEEVLAKSYEPISESVFSDMTFCYIGRLSAEKGVREIVEMFCNLPQTPKSISLIMIGEGYMQPELQEIAKTHHREENVHFVGTKENPYPYIRKSDVILCASHKESFGLVVLESLLIGKCVVSTCCGGPEELIVDKKTGYLVGDYQEFYDVIKRLYYGELPLLEGDAYNAKYQNLKKEFFESFYKIVNEVQGIRK